MSIFVPKVIIAEAGSQMFWRITICIFFGVFGKKLGTWEYYMEVKESKVEIRFQAVKIRCPLEGC